MNAVPECGLVQDARTLRFKLQHMLHAGIKLKYVFRLKLYRIPDSAGSVFAGPALVQFPRRPFATRYR